MDLAELETHGFEMED